MSVDDGGGGNDAINGFLQPLFLVAFSEWTTGMW